jgi:hypothetical protein
MQLEDTQTSCRSPVSRCFPATCTSVPYLARHAGAVWMIILREQIFWQQECANGLGASRHLFLPKRSRRLAGRISWNGAILRAAGFWKTSEKIAQRRWFIEQVLRGWKRCRSWPRRQASRLARPNDRPLPPQLHSLHRSTTPHILQCSESRVLPTTTCFSSRVSSTIFSAWTMAQ